MPQCTRYSNAAHTQTRNPINEELPATGSTSAQCQNRWKRIQFRIHPLGEQISREFRINDFQTSINQAKALVNSIHGPSHISRTLLCDEVMKQCKRLDFAASCVKKWRAQDIHTLYIDCRFRSWIVYRLYRVTLWFFRDRRRTIYSKLQ